MRSPLFAILLVCSCGDGEGDASITVTYSGAGSLRVTSSPAGIDCGATSTNTCSASFPRGTQVSISTMDTAGHFCFAVNCTVQPSSAGTCASIEVDQPIEVQIACVIAAQ